VAAHLILKPASATPRPTSEWNRRACRMALSAASIKANAAPVGSLWMWALALVQGQIEFWGPLSITEQM
jgi:hypothetical protein